MIAAVLALLLLAGADPAAELASIREQIVALEIERALGGIESFLARPDLSEGARAEALDLRAQAHVASGDLAAAEKDYREILALRPGYTPPAEVTTKKAMERFLKVRAILIGTVVLDVDPADARWTVDGREVRPGPGGTLPWLVGDHRVRAERAGFDPQDATLRVVAGQETLVRLRLIPNARSIVVRTDVSGVQVRLDGAPVGATDRTPGGATDVFELLLENVPIGEHAIQLDKPCFATETLHEMVSVDIEDRSPRLLRPVTLRPSFARVAARGARYDGELRIDGVRASTLPLESFEMCPGRRLVEAIASGRVVWSGEVTVEEAAAEIDLTPRPNVALVGDDWPAGWGQAAGAWSLRGRLEAPATADLSTSAGWSAVRLPPDTDLALAVMRRSGSAGEDRIALYAPALGVIALPATAPPASRPAWTSTSIGLGVVDAGARGVVVAEVEPQGPAASAGVVPGDRVTAVAGRPVDRSAAVRDAVDGQGPGRSFALDVLSAGGVSRSLAVVGIAVPRWGVRSREGSDAVRAAWASVDAAAGGDPAAPALAELAILLERAGRTAAARGTWRRLASLDSGALGARAEYALAAALEAEGKRDEARQAFTRVRANATRAKEWILAAAAADRLADLGVASR